MIPHGKLTNQCLSEFGAPEWLLVLSISSPSPTPTPLPRVPNLVFIVEDKCAGGGGGIVDAPHIKLRRSVIRCLCFCSGSAEFVFLLHSGEWKFQHLVTSILPPPKLFWHGITGADRIRANPLPVPATR